MRKILHWAGVPTCEGRTDRDSQRQRQAILVRDFLPSDTTFLERAYLLFFIDVARCVHVAGVTAHHVGA